MAEVHADWKPSTSRACRYSLKGWALWAHGEDHPIRRKRIHVPEADDPLVLTPKETQRFLVAIDRKTDLGKRDFAIVRLMLDCGMRASEVGRIQVDNVDLEARKLSLLQKQGRRHRPVFGEPSQDALEDWLGIRSRHTQNGALFVSLGGPKPGEALNRSGVYNLFRSLSIESGIKVSPHVIRYSFMDHALRRGIPMKVIAAQGGWESINTVERYARGMDAEVFRGFLPEYA